MRRYLFINHNNPHDIRVIETFREFTELEEQIGFFLFSITKMPYA